MLVVFSEQCLEYSFPFHPESAERVKSIYDSLERNGFRFVNTKLASKDEVLKVHTAEHFKKIESGNYFDPDTPIIDIKYPLLAAGTAIKAAKLQGFALARPPGHHAGKNFLGGFCYLNNIAIAVKALNKKRTAILDIDAHHGNGTEDIFFNDKQTLYVSLHQSSLYPGTGLKSEANCFNFPLPRKTEEKRYLKTLSKALEKVVDFNPDIVAVSLGFDTYYKDPLSDFELKEKSYEKIAKMLRKAIDSINAKCFVVLEGGYSKEIGKLALSFFKNF